MNTPASSPGTSPDSPPAPDHVRKSDLRYHVAAILLLSVAVYYLLDSAADDEVLDIRRLLDFQAQEYDYYMNDIDSVHYAADGKADYRFQAQRLTHFPNPEFSVIETPRFQIFLEDNSAWQVDSENGRVEPDPETLEDRLILQDNVVIQGLLRDGTRVNIYTDSLTLYPESKTLHSDSEVRFETEGLTSSSTGISADLEQETFRQLANGKIRYAL